MHLFEHKETVYDNDWNAFAHLTLVIVCSSIVSCGLRSFIPLYWVDVLGLSAAAAGSALTLLFSLGVVMTLIGGLMADRFGYLKIVRMDSIAFLDFPAIMGFTLVVSLSYVLINMAVDVLYSFLNPQIREVEK